MSSFKINSASVGSAITVRPSATALFTVDSADRYANYDEARVGTSSPYDFIIRKTTSLLNGFFSRIALTEVVFPFTIPNIGGSTTSMNLEYQIDGGALIQQQINFSERFATPVEFATAIQSLIRTLSGNVAFTFEYGTGIDRQPTFNYDTTNDDTVAFSPVAISAAFPFPNQIQLFDMLGFKVGANGNNALSTDGVGEPTFFQRTKYFDIVSTFLTGNQNLKDGTSAPIVRDIIARVYVEYENSYNVPPDDPLFAPAGTVPMTIYRKYPVPKHIQWDLKQPIGQLNFQVYDQDGVLLTTEDYYGQDWAFTLLCSEN
jgi:hypothetical protein